MKTVSPASPASPVCYVCRKSSHFVKECPGKFEATKWCSYHKSTTHTDGECRRHNRRDRTKQAIFSEQTKTIEGEHSFAFHVEDHTNRHHNNPTGLLVDTGATSHIVTTNAFKRVDETFKPREHCMELADGTKTMNVAVKRGDAEVTLKDVNGSYVKTVLKDALFIPS